MNVLITGVSGFVGPYLREAVEKRGHKVYGMSRKNADFECDVTDAEGVLKVVEKVKPDAIFHLAGFSSVSKSFEKTDECFEINVNGTKNLLDAVVSLKINPKIIVVSSVEAYGIPNYIPIDENHPLNPITPYGKSRVAQENLVKEYDRNVIVARSFNHTGPNQSESYVIPSFKKQINEAKDGDNIYVGNLNIVRDFSDVRDVVEAYCLLLEKGEKGVYNVGSGKAYSLKYILDELIKKSGKKLNVVVDEKKYRKVDIPVLLADNQKIRKLGATFHHSIFD